jgi:hypothetical protein
MSALQLRHYTVRMRRSQRMRYRLPRHAWRQVRAVPPTVIEGFKNRPSRRSTSRGAALATTLATSREDAGQQRHERALERMSHPGSDSIVRTCYTPAGQRLAVERESDAWVVRCDDLEPARHHDLDAAMIEALRADVHAHWAASTRRDTRA